jgi:hypothetical protein
MPRSTVPGTPLRALKPPGLLALAPSRRTTAAAAETAAIDTAIRRARGWTPRVACSGG